MLVAITGSIACGKSTVSNYLISLGYSVVDADKIGHQILFDTVVKEKLIASFSNSILTNNEIDRAKLGAIVFNDKEALNKLNNITHPRIKEIIKEQILYNEPIQFLDIALLFEANFTNLVEKIIVVHVDEDVQLARLITRNNLSKNDALKKITSQIPSVEKVKLADYVIDNNGSIENTHKQIDEILEILKGEKYGIKNK